jgi:hypothetical protein
MKISYYLIFFFQIYNYSQMCMHVCLVMFLKMQILGMHHHIHENVNDRRNVRFPNQTPHKY